MRGPNQYDSEVHAEVEDLEDLRVGERQHHDAGKLGQRDAGEDAAAGFREGQRGPLHVRAGLVLEGPDDVRDELDADANALKEKTKVNLYNLDRKLGAR